MITIYEKEEREQGFRTISRPKKGCWIHVESGTVSDVKRVSSWIGLDYSDVSDSLDRYEIPRVERIEEHVLIFTRHPASPEGGLYTTTCTVILSKDYFITICPQESPLLKGLLEQKGGVSPCQKTKFLTSILLKITQEYTLQIKKIRTRVLRQEKNMAKVDSHDIVMLTMSEEVLNQYQSSLIHMRAVLESVTSGRYTFLYEKDQDLLEDLLNASMQSESLCSFILRSIRSLRDSYQIIFTNQLNKTIQRLTGLTIILSIPTMVSSLYGMNVSLPIAQWSHAFLIIMLFITLISAIFLFIFQKNKWL